MSGWDHLESLVVAVGTLSWESTSSFGFHMNNCWKLQSLWRASIFALRSGGVRVHMNLTDENYLSVISCVPTALSPRGGPCTCGVSLSLRLMCLSLNCFHQFPRSKEFKDDLRGPFIGEWMWENSLGQLTQTAAPWPRRCLCYSAVGHKLCQSSKRLLFPRTQLPSLFPRWLHFTATFKRWREEKGIWRKRALTIGQLSGFLSPKKVVWPGRFPEWLKTLPVL